MPRQQDNLCLNAPFSDSFQRLDAVHLRHPDVEDHCIHRVRFQDVKTAPGRVRRETLKFISQGERHGLSGRGIVINYEDGMLLFHRSNPGSAEPEIRRQEGPSAPFVHYGNREILCTFLPADVNTPTPAGCARI